MSSSLVLYDIVTCIVFCKVFFFSAYNKFIYKCLYNYWGLLRIEIAWFAYSRYLN